MLYESSRGKSGYHKKDKILLIVETTDDHGMHIIGLVEDQNGTKYFKVKNSWGTEYNQCGGYFYASFPYVRYKTMNILVHKDAVPKSIKKKIGL